MRHTRLVYAPVITAEFNRDSLNKVSKSTNTLSLPCLVETARNMLDGASSSERRLLRRLINQEIAHYARYSMKAAEPIRSEEHTSELQSLMRISYAVFCLKKK